MKKKLFNAGLLVFLLATSVLPLALAQEATDAPGYRQTLEDIKNKLEGTEKDPVNVIDFSPDTTGERTGEKQTIEVIQSVLKTIRNLLAPIAVLLIVISGIRMMTAQGNEEVLEKERQSILYALLGLLVIVLLPPGIEALLGAPQTAAEATLEDRPAAVSGLVGGLIPFVRTLIALAAVFMIVLSGIRMMTAQGAEEEIKTQRQGIVWVLVGLIVVGLSQTVAGLLYVQPVLEQGGFTGGTVGGILGVFSKIAVFVLGFVGLIALAAFVFGAGTMVLNFGNEEQVTKGKNIMKTAVIGILLILSAYAIISTLLSFGSA